MSEWREVAVPYRGVHGQCLGRVSGSGIELFLLAVVKEVMRVGWE